MRLKCPLIAFHKVKVRYRVKVCLLLGGDNYLHLDYKGDIGKVILRLGECSIFAYLRIKINIT